MDADINASSYDPSKTLLLTVALDAVTVEDREVLQKRFGDWYDGMFKIENPVSIDSHAFDVFRDEFEDNPKRKVYFARLVWLPYPVEQFTPFTDDIDGTELAEWSPAIAGGEWNCWY